jgi:NDP-sugar pyrophosphorylase family protein
MDAIVLAGGKGTRMEGDIPKVLAKIKGKPMIDYQIDFLSKFKEIKKIIIALGYKSDEIIAHVKKNYPSKQLEFSVEDKPIGTAGGLKKALPHANSEMVLVLNSDNLANINVSKLSRQSESTICVAHRRSPFGRIIEKEGYAVFEEKPLLRDWTSCGWYLFKKSDIIKVLPDLGSLEYDVFPKIKMRLFKHKSFCWSLNSKKDIEELEKEGFPDDYPL